MYSCPYFCNMMRCNNKTMYSRRKFTKDEAAWVSKFLLINFDQFDVKQFRVGLNVELEHGAVDSVTNITNDDLIMTGKIALAHLNKYPDYYKRLNKMEEEAEQYWGDETSHDTNRSLQWLRCLEE